jgi:hypothetical protein
MAMDGHVSVDQLHHVPRLVQNGVLERRQALGQERKVLGGNGLRRLPAPIQSAHNRVLLMRASACTDLVASAWTGSRPLQGR